MRFELKVLDANGVLSALLLDAQSEKDAETQAAKLGYSALSISKSMALNLSWFNKKTTFDVLLFSQELVALLNAGLSLVVSVETLTEKSADPNQQQILQVLLQKLHEGQTFSYAMGTLPHIFSDLLIALIKSSEKTGDLKHALQRFIQYRTQLDVVKTRLVTACIYPVLLLLVGGLVSVFLLGYVVPKFSSIYENAGDNIPFLSRMLMQWGNLVHQHAAYVVIGAIMLLAAIAIVLTRQSVRAGLIKWLCSVPKLGEKLHLYQLARFYRTLGMLLQGGIPMVTALQMSADLLSHALHQHLNQAIKQVKEGKPLSIALEQNGLATAVSRRMMSVGEQAGNMGEMMENTASFYDYEIARWVDWATRLIEPLLMVFIGLMIGGIVILMYMPIFELADSIQ